MADLKELKNSRRLIFVHQLLAMGDALFLSPVYKTIKDNLIGVEISVFTNQYAIPFVKAIPYVDNIYPLEPFFLEGDSSIKRLLKLCFFFIRGRFDTIVLRDDKRIPQRSLQLASILCRLKTIAIGHYLEKEVHETKHIVDTYLSILQQAGLNVLEREKLYLNLNPSHITDAKAFLKNETERLAGIFPVSKMKIKNWTPDKTAKLIKKLREMSYHVILFCADKEFSENVVSLSGGGSLTVVGIIDFSLLMGIVSLCQIAIGVDTGLTHLAATLGVPTVGLYGPTSGIVTGPYSKIGIPVQSGIKCPHYNPIAPFSPKETLQECYIKDMCLLQMINCVEKIEVEEVINIIHNLRGKEIERVMKI